MSRLLRYFVFGALAAAVSVDRVESRADVFWNGSSDADWANAANWTGGSPAAPGAGNAIINAGSPNATPTVTMLGSSAAGQIYVSINAGLDVIGGSLTASDLVTGLWGNSGTVSVSGGKLSLSNYLNMGAGGYDGKVDISGGTLESSALSINTTGGATMRITGTGAFVTAASQLGNVSYWVAHQAIVTSGAGRYVNIDTVTAPGKLVLTSALRTTTDIVWDNGSGDSQWTTPTNWNPDGMPGPLDTARITNELSAFLTGTAGTVSGVIIGDAANNGALNVQGAGSLTAGSIIVGSTSNASAWPSYYSHADGFVTTTGDMVFGATGGRSQSYFSAGTLQVGGTMHLGSSPGAGQSSLALNGGGGTITAGSLQVGTQGSLAYDFLGGTSLKTLGVTNGISLTGSSALTIRNAAAVSLGASYTLLDGLSLTGTFGSVTFDGFAADLSPTIVYDAAAGNVVLTVGAVTPGITINVASGTQTQAQAGYPAITGTVPVTKTGAGTLVLDQTNPVTGSTTIQGGVLRLAAGAALAASRIVPVAGGTLALSPSLETSVGGLAPLAGGLTDLGNGRLTAADGLAASDLVAALVAGRNGGTWDGTSGITSSLTAAQVATFETRAVGWVDNGDGSMTTAYAAQGDTNLDWLVDILDVSNFVAAGKFGTGAAASWTDGDFNYDGIVDIQDVADFSAAGLYGAGNYNPSSTSVLSVSAVPEPVAGWSLVVAGLLTAGGVLRRRPAADAGGSASCRAT